MGNHFRAGKERVALNVLQLAEGGDF